MKIRNRKYLFVPGLLIVIFATSSAFARNFLNIAYVEVKRGTRDRLILIPCKNNIIGGFLSATPGQAGTNLVYLTAALNRFSACGRGRKMAALGAPNDLPKRERRNHGLEHDVG